ncbi:hypothetical protein F5Y19DRAFT_121303 [Xylariaceae sp. FL1651]|nr:hypothetical protein F5Y19DRAFT_121303 [Xylariaceae sp. FL1651]
MHPSNHDPHVSFDLLGLVFSDEVTAGCRSAERRSNKLSFLEEITAEQMKTYSPVQIAIILQQRENLLSVLSEQHQTSSQAQQPYHLPSGNHDGLPLKPPPGFDYPDNRKPWIPRENEECQAKYCHRCRPSCEARSYLSLDGVVNGEVPPSAATGFGFHRMGIRPVVDVRVVRDIGLRPVPWPRAQVRPLPSLPSSRSSWTLSDVIEDHLVEAVYIESEPLLESGEAPSIDSMVSSPSRASIFEEARPPWSPPSTPTSWTGVAQRENGMTTFEHRPFICDGRSPKSLKVNGHVRHKVIESITGLMDQELEDDQTEEFGPLCSPVSFDESEQIRASLTPLTSSTSDEGVDRQESATPMMLEELREGYFHQEPLDVGNGIAVFEESVGLGVPDVIAQA